MGELLKRKKGLTIVELIIAITLFAIITVPLMAGFANVAMINKLTKNQIEINAAANQVQQEVIDSVKKNSSVTLESGSGNIRGATLLKGIKVGEGKSNFIYDSEYKGVTGVNGSTQEYLITLYKKKGANFQVVEKFNVQVNVD
ncbi:PulJ/GspJ family protein [Pseudobacteroides cellulosolvens]|uniref:Prepilin-type N-terminal cleavage/methylation domain-containing protein n=1 Tax=Pseudobacteroides cellulosolvens ATCC 35603 = DSM 2933 TaxID=398512 RepID=A0A0L6JQV8_9FIRM|nr:prepilin-type N-terminal cleavage/methylation domain-containing protein [Pseudobacteroides cellulosolvens]KNY28201.1 hypothetical protein Bccel_3475 [Pseudobacteroides cellulosolvens ATCC 35603 = DSM 2933]